MAKKPALSIHNAQHHNDPILLSIHSISTRIIQIFPKMYQLPFHTEQALSPHNLNLGDLGNSIKIQAHVEWLDHYCEVLDTFWGTKKGILSITFLLLNTCISGTRIQVDRTKNFYLRNGPFLLSRMFPLQTSSLRDTALDTGK